MIILNKMKFLNKFTINTLVGKDIVINLIMFIYFTRYPLGSRTVGNMQNKTSPTQSKI